MNTAPVHGPDIRGCRQALLARQSLVLDLRIAAADRLLDLPANQRDARIEWRGIAEACRREDRRLARRIRSLARANGCDQPASARGGFSPKTPAAQERERRVAAAARKAANTSARRPAPTVAGGGVR
jgi:hypothetical protein